MPQPSKSLKALQRALGSGPERLLLGLDFDGTLAHLAPRPHLARLPERTRRLLRRLSSSRQVRVAVISGRSLSSLRGKVRLPGLFYAGNHGLEILGPRGFWVHPRARAARRDVRSAALRLRKGIPAVPGARLEEKGLTLSLHFRESRDPKAKSRLRRLIDRALRSHDGRLRVSGGKKVWEVRPRVAWDKGMALLRLKSALGGSWGLGFVGDDDTDEEAFRRLGPRALTVRVGGASGTRARFRLAGPPEVGRLLSILAGRRP